jgi:hypothetical protein
MCLFKKKNKFEYTSTSKAKLTGDVEFVNKNKVDRGVIFGSPIASGDIFRSSYKYYVRTPDGLIHIVEESAIQEVRE